MLQITQNHVLPTAILLYNYLVCISPLDKHIVKPIVLKNRYQGKEGKNVISFASDDPFTRMRYNKFSINPDI